MGMWKGGIRLRVGASCGGLGNLAPACWVLYQSKFEDLRPAWQVLLIVLLPALLFLQKQDIPHMRRRFDAFCINWPSYKANKACGRDKVVKLRGL